MHFIIFWRCFSRLRMINSCPQSSTSIFILWIGRIRSPFNLPASEKLLLLVGFQHHHPRSVVHSLPLQLRTDQPFPGPILASTKGHLRQVTPCCLSPIAIRRAFSPPDMPTNAHRVRPRHDSITGTPRMRSLLIELVHLPVVFRYVYERTSGRRDIGV